MNPPSWFEFLDQLRRLQGMTLDSLGLGPRESAFQVVFTQPGLRLRRYGVGAANSPPLLIVPAPIKRPYIWDLSPERSVVRRAIEHKLGVYLVEWTEPDKGTWSPGLPDYSGPMLDACIAVTAEQTGSDRVFLMGHSLGGVFAALHSAYRPEHVAGLALIDVPLHFAKAAGVFRAPFGLGIPARQERRSSAPVPGSLLGMISASAAPGTFCASRYLDYLASMGSREQMATHWRVERWTMDELPMPRTLFDDVVQGLYRQNSFMQGELAIGGIQLHPRNITAPILSVYQNSTITPAESVLAFHRAAGSADKELVPYFGDVGVALQHVGPLVGDNAYRHVWPRVFNWLDRISGPPLA